MTNESHEIDGRPKSNVDLWATLNTSPYDQDVHILPLDRLFQRFQTNQCTGLSTAVVQEARAQYGKNRITSSQSPAYFWLLIRQLFIGFNLILWIAGVLALIPYRQFGTSNSSTTNWGLAVALFLVIISNTMFNLYQEIKAIKIVASFSALLPTIAVVRRNNIEQQIAADELVPGDIILIQMDQKLPADCRFFVCDGLKINASELTGESKPVVATVECSSETFMKSTNIGLYSSLVERGTGEAVVIATGDKTVLGKMSNTIRGNSSKEITGLHRELNRIVLVVMLAAIVGIIILWITWATWLEHIHPTFVDFTDNILNSIGMIVGFLPLGLPSVIILVLIVAAKRMYHQGILGKNLQIVETFNYVSVLATDKTGTLTENKMTVNNVLWDTDGEYKVGEFEEESVTKSTKLSTIAHRGRVAPIPVAGRSSDSTSNESKLRPSVSGAMKIGPFRDLILGAALCNDAERQLLHTNHSDQGNADIDSELRLIGDPVDVALYKLCVYGCHTEIDEIRCLNPHLKVLPFNSLNKFMISANRLESYNLSSTDMKSTVLITFKGAPEIVIQRCSLYKTSDNQILPLTVQIKEKFFNRQETLGKSGYRVIAMCQQQMTEKRYDQMVREYEAKQRTKAINNELDFHGFPENNYCFLGFFSLFDPPRIDVADAILKVRRAQIQVLMMTGDHSTTAKAIGKQVNILSSQISETNGIDTLKIEAYENNRLIIRLYRNDTLLQEYVPVKVPSFTVENKVSGGMVKLVVADRENTDPVNNPVWYERCWSWCKNQLTESKPILNENVEKETIPYAIVVTGSEIDLLDDLMWNWVLSHEELIFARTSPDQKLRIVTECQRRGKTVAVIGDGINDVPALKCADLSIAMQSGTKMSKEASDIILLDDNFSLIIQTIETGRLISDNLKKVFIYLLPGGSWSEVWPVFFNIWFGIPLALSPFMAIVFCMLNDVFMSYAMVLEKAETNIMSRPPFIRKKDHLLSLRSLLHAYLFVGNIQCFTAFFCYCYYWIDNGVPFYSFMFTYENFGINPRTNYTLDQLDEMINVSQSIYYSSLCVFQFFNFFASRTRYVSILQHNPFWGKNRNLYAFGGMLISTGIQLILTQISWFNRVFGTAPIPPKYVMPTVGFGMLWLLIDELRKLYIRKYPLSLLAKITW